MFVADSWDVQDARMSAINVPAVVAAFEPRFEGEAVPSWSDVEALEETATFAPEVEAAVETANNRRDRHASSPGG